MVLFFFDVQSYLQNIDIMVAWRTSLCGSPASQTYLMYEAYDQTTQSNLTPGFKPFIVSNSYLIRRKRRCENKQKKRKEQKNIHECSLDGAWTSSIFDRVSCEEETKTAVNETTRLKRNSQRWHNFFCQLPKFFPSTSVVVLAIPNPARQKDIFFCPEHRRVAYLSVLWRKICGELGS